MIFIDLSFGITISPPLRFSIDHITNEIASLIKILNLVIMCGAFGWQTTPGPITPKYEIFNYGIRFMDDFCTKAYPYVIDKKNTKIAIFCFSSGNELRNINVQRSFLNKSSGLIYLKPHVH